MSQAQVTTDLREWIGREQEQSDEITIAPLVGLSATLDRDDPVPRVGDPLPPFWHWLFFLPNMSTSKLRPDGHAPLGGFMPPVNLPRRMWAGSRLTFAHAPRVGLLGDRWRGQRRCWLVQTRRYRSAVLVALRKSSETVVLNLEVRALAAFRGT